MCEVGVGLSLTVFEDLCTGFSDQKIDGLHCLYMCHILTLCFAVDTLSIITDCAVSSQTLLVCTISAHPLSLSNSAKPGHLLPLHLLFSLVISPISVYLRDMQGILVIAGPSSWWYNLPPFPCSGLD